jgi:hypothetical protein
MNTLDEPVSETIVCVPPSSLLPFGDELNAFFALTFLYHAGIFIAT